MGSQRWNGRSADVVVVGGGSAGAATAGRLAAAGVDVLLVEAGPDYGPFGSGRWPAEVLDAAALATSHDWGYASGPVAGRAPWTWERARILGGCSAHNGAIAAVGHHTDYDAWGLAGWSTDELRPLFATALAAMCVRAYEPHEAGPFHARCLDAAVSARWRIASDLCDLDANESFGLETVNVVDGIRWNSAFAYLDPVRGSGRLTIVDRAIVDRLEETDTGVVVHAIVDGTPTPIGADTVVIAAGVYGTPAILQRSGIGDPGRLRAVGVEPVVESPLVGSNLHDHPMVNAGRELAGDLRRAIEEATARGFVPEEQTLGKARSSLATDGVFDLHLFPVCASTQTTFTGGRALVEVACMTPRSRGRVDIVSTDPEEHPRIDHRYLTDHADHDLTVLRDGLVLAEDLLAQPALADVLLPEPPRDVSDAAIRRDVMHYYHPVGTAPMGTDPATSVCAPDGRVHGLTRVVVGDVSLMPQIPRANTNIPAVVIGERIAAFLLGQRRSHGHSRDRVPRAEVAARASGAGAPWHTPVMADTSMTAAEREAFLADVHVGVLAVERPGKGPLVHPIWYVFDGADVTISMEADSVKARLLARAGRASMTVQVEHPPYRYVTVEGPVTLEPAHDGDGYDLREVAIRYLGPEAGAHYAESTSGTYAAVAARLRPEHWTTVDYGKA